MTLDDDLDPIPVQPWELPGKDIADWVVATCLFYGTSVATAYQVAGLFVSGVRPNERR